MEDIISLNPKRFNQYMEEYGTILLKVHSWYILSQY